jgi:heterodisulfide reductase subunit D
MNTLQGIINKNRAWACLDCGKCSAVCPITHWETRRYASPRTLIEKSILGHTEEMMDETLFWSCLICKRCTELCPSDVHFIEFIREARSMARNYDRFGDCSHSETIQTWGRMMTSPGLKQNRLSWLTGDLKTSETSDTIYFTGCLPYYDPLFRKLNFEGVKIARAAVKIMNYLGIKPQVLDDEVCCGHDQLWEGDVETFRQLAVLNLERLKARGAKRVVTTCPECTRTLKIDYPQLVGSLGMEILHISELIAEANLVGQSQSMTPIPGNSPHVPWVTYQDPCHLGRHLGIYDAPRKVINNLGLELREMERIRNASLCCGTSCWRACGQVSKSIQVDRLREAKATGAEVLVTTCLKCQIHFKCAQEDPILGEQIDIQIRDLTTLVADMLPE